MTDKVYKHCEECYDENFFSKCCYDEVYNGKCANCGKFCKLVSCNECGGFSPISLTIGDEVEIFMYNNSKQYLLSQFGNRKFKKSKFYRGKIKKILSKNKVLVKLSNREVEIYLDDLDVY